MHEGIAELLGVSGWELLAVICALIVVEELGVCGLLDVPRPTFLKGLLPGVALYEGVFLGIGLWLGPTAWSTVERYAPKPGQIVVALALLVGAAVLSHTCVGFVRRVGLRIPARAATTRELG
jgi:hypothetical protein